MAILSFIYVNDLDIFISYLRKFDIDVYEYEHIVLLDSSEYMMLICRKNGKVIAYIAVHYIDSHYAALINLKENAQDREIIEALLNIEKNSIWKVPVEPIIYIADDEFINIINKYTDEVPIEASIYLNIYQSKNEAGFLRDIAHSMLNLVEYLNSFNGF
jgi:ABC-type oligopeptide transport system substrate-binding subunit